jgi:flagellar biosynthesis GTPase FlhF
LDLPGIPWQNRAALEALRRRAQAWGPVQWHVVVSAAYDVRLMLQQVQAYSVLPLAGVIVTHVDEQPALGKLWNLLCGTNCSVRFLAGGQNIPGEFSLATPAALGPAILWAEMADISPTAAPAAAGKASAMQGVADWQ